MFNSVVARLVLRTTIGLGIFLFLMWYFSSVTMYLIISFIVAFILRAPTNFIARLHIFGFRIPRSLAILLSFAVLIGVLALFVLMFVPLIVDQIERISKLDFESIAGRIESYFHEFEELLISYKFMEKEQSILTSIDVNQVFSFVKSIKINDLVSNLIGYLGNLLMGIISVLFITFFVLYEKGAIQRRIIAQIPNKYFEVGISAVTKVERLLGNYLLGLSIQMVAVFTIVSTGLLIAGIHYALTIAVFAAIANLIPFIGPLLGASFAVLVGITTATYADLVDSSYLFISIKILIVFGIMQLIDNILLQPIIYSKSVKAHPLEIFLIVFVGATLAGALGMIAAIPTYTIVKVTLMEFYKGIKQYKVFKN